MIMRDITGDVPLVHAACGHAAHLIETRGRAQTDKRLFGLPSVQYHVECNRCQLSTTPVFKRSLALRLWSYGDTSLVPTHDLPALRMRAEQQLIRAA